MTSLFLVVILLAFFSGITHRSKNLNDDLPTCVTEGMKVFFSDLVVVIKSLKQKKAIEVEVNKEDNLPNT